MTDGSGTPPFVPDDFDPPTVVEAEVEGHRFRLEPLGAEHNQRDHEAWMSSIDFIHTLPGFRPGERTWPVEMSVEANRNDLVMHAEHFRDRVGFTYSVLEGDDVVGCVYIYPGPDPSTDDHDAEIRSWVTERRSDLDPVFERWMSRWLDAVWPFDRPRYR